MSLEASWLSRTVLASVKHALTVKSRPMARKPRVQSSTGSHTMPVSVVPNETTNAAHDWNVQASVSRWGGIGSMSPPFPTSPDRKEEAGERPRHGRTVRNPSQAAAGRADQRDRKSVV